MGNHWDTAFGRWVKRYTVTKLAGALQISRNAIHAWFRVNDPVIPRPDKARVILHLAEGELHYEDIYGTPTPPSTERVHIGA